MVREGTANPGTLGAAFDFVLRFRLDPSHVPMVAVQGFGRRPTLLEAAVSMVRAAISAAQADESGDDLYRAGWTRVLLTELYQADLMLASPLIPLLETDRFTAENLLALAPDTR